MDRVIVYIDQNPLDTDQLNQSKNTMIGLGMLIQAVLGTGTLIDGLTCVPTAPASLQVVVGPGSIYSLENVDSTAYGSIPADEAHQIMKQGIVLDPVTLNCPAPGTSGYSVNYLVQAIYQDTDTGSTVLPYYNSDNPDVAYNGPGGTGVSQNTVREGQLIISAKAGVAATTGTQTTPAPDAGYTGLYVVTVQNTQTQITSGSIAQVSAAPFISNKLTALAPLASPALTGVPTVPTALPGTTTTQVASTAFVQTAVGSTNRRILLTANATFYVNASTGSDSNTGLTSGSPWATIQHAVNTIGATYDLGGYAATIQLADGTYSPVAITSPFVGCGSSGIIIQGDQTTPANTVISATTSNASAIYVENSVCTLKYLTIQSSSASGINTSTLGFVVVGPGVSFGACPSGAHMNAAGGSSSAILISSNYSVVGSAINHVNASSTGSVIDYQGGNTITMTGSLTFSSFAQVNFGAEIFAPGITFAGGAITGQRYQSVNNGIITTNGGGPSYFPGSTAGTTSNGGIYV